MTSTAVVLSVVVPSPSWPSPFPPQHLIAPPASTAHVWPLPMAILVAVEIPVTSTEVMRWAVVPSPSWPSSL